VPVTNSVDEAEYVIRIRVAVPQECVNTYSTRRVATPLSYVSVKMGSRTPSEEEVGQTADGPPLRYLGIYTIVLSPILYGV